MVLPVTSLPVAKPAGVGGLFGTGLPVTSLLLAKPPVVVGLFGPALSPPGVGCRCFGESRRCWAKALSSLKVFLHSQATLAIMQFRPVEADEGVFSRQRKAGQASTLPWLTSHTVTPPRVPVMQPPTQPTAFLFPRTTNEPAGGNTIIASLMPFALPRQNTLASPRLKGPELGRS